MFFFDPEFIAKMGFQTDVLKSLCDWLRLSISLATHLIKNITTVRTRVCRIRVSASASESASETDSDTSSSAKLWLEQVKI